MPLGFGSLKDFKRLAWVVTIAVAALCLAGILKLLGVT